MIECNCNAEDYEGCHHVDCPVGIAEWKEYQVRYNIFAENCVSCGAGTTGKCGDLPTCERCYRDGALRKWMDDNEIDE